MFQGLVVEIVGSERWQKLPIGEWVVRVEGHMRELKYLRR